MSTSPVKLWRRQKKTVDLIGERGKIVSFTFVRVPPRDFVTQAPYPVVIVEFSGKRLIGQLVDWEESQLKINQEVLAVLRRARTENHEDIIPYTIKFKPI